MSVRGGVLEEGLGEAWNGRWGGTDGRDGRSELLLAACVDYV